MTLRVTGCSLLFLQRYQQCKDSCWFMNVQCTWRTLDVCFCCLFVCLFTLNQTLGFCDDFESYQLLLALLTTLSAMQRFLLIHECAMHMKNSCTHQVSKAKFSHFDGTRGDKNRYFEPKSNLRILWWLWELPAGPRSSYDAISNAKILADSWMCNAHEDYDRKNRYFVKYFCSHKSNLRIVWSLWELLAAPCSSYDAICNAKIPADSWMCNAHEELLYVPGDCPNIFFFIFVHFRNLLMPNSELQRPHWGLKS